LIPNRNKIRVVLADDHHIVRAAFVKLLEKEPDIEVVGEAADTTSLMGVVKSLTPNVLLLDAHMPGGKVTAAAQAIRDEVPSVRILVLSAYERREYVIGLVRAGVAGYILKHDSPDMLVRAVRTVAMGEDWLSPRVVDILMKSMRAQEEPPKTRLSPREVEILKLMADGYRNDEIAAKLVITSQTVKNHVRSIFMKLHVNTRVEAVLYALNQDLDAVEPSLENDLI
jgi:two-component system, NarL family, response regulator LiaR